MIYVGIQGADVHGNNACVLKNFNVVDFVDDVVDEVLRATNVRFCLSSLKL